MTKLLLLLTFTVCVLAQNPPNPPSCPGLQWYDRGWTKGYASADGMALFDEFTNNCRTEQIAMYENDCLTVLAYCINQEFGYVTEHSYFPVFETAHSILMLGILHQHEQGYFDWEDKISSHWPAFGANGKENITFDDFVSGTSGLTHFEDGVKAFNYAEGTGNRTGFEELIIGQTPTWEPKTHYQSPYHVWGYVAVTMSKYIDPLGRYLDHYIQEEIFNRSSSLDQSLYGLSFIFGIDTENQLDRSQIRLSVEDREERTDVFGFWYKQQIESSSIYDWEHATLTYKVFEGILGVQRSELMWRNYDFNSPFYSPMHTMYTSSVTLAKLAQNLALSNSSFLSQASVERMRTSRYHGYDATSYEDLHITAGGFRLGSERYPIPNGTFASVSLHGSVVLVDPENAISMAYLTGNLAPEGETHSALTTKARNLIYTAVGIEIPTVPETTEDTPTTEDTEPLTTGPVTTGPVTTGSATTGPVTTGPVTTGVVTTGPAATTGYAYCSRHHHCPSQPRDFCDPNDDRCKCRYGFEGFNCSCANGSIAWFDPDEPFCLHGDECIQSLDCGTGLDCVIASGQDVGNCESEPTSPATTGVATTGTTGASGILCTENWQCDAQPNAFCNAQNYCECHYGFVGDGDTCDCLSEFIAWEGPVGSQQPYCLSEGECTQNWHCNSPETCDVPSGHVVGTCV